jgi:transposase-like protein
MKEKDCPKTLVEAVRYFADPRIAHDFVASIRWPDGVVKCPRCGASEGLAFLENQLRWTCKQCRTAKRKWQFSVKVGTIMEDSPIGIDKWLCAMWLIVSAKNGISSHELHRSLGITQKSAWFLSHRIRLALQRGSIEKLKGQVEADETFIGARARNMHQSKKRRSMYGTAVMKTAVLGLLERNSPEKPSRVKLKIVESVRRHDLDPVIREHVEKGSEVHTDKLRSYENLDDEYVHQVIDHAECYARGHVHTNGLENFWSLLKRGIRGTYVNVEPFHLFRYLDEQAFRFNERKGTDADRFLAALPSIIGRRLTYKGLTGNVGLN